MLSTPLCEYFQIFLNQSAWKMGRSGQEQCRGGSYRPQRPKAGGRNNVQKEMVSDRSGGIVDRVKQMMKESRGQGIGPGRLCRVLKSGPEGKDSTADDCLKEVVSEVNEVQLSKEGQERKGVKRSLFGDVGLTGGEEEVIPVTWAQILGDRSAHSMNPLSSPGTKLQF